MRIYKAYGEDTVFAEMWKYAGNTSLNLILEKSGLQNNRPQL